MKTLAEIESDFHFEFANFTSVSDFFRAHISERDLVLDILTDKLADAEKEIERLKEDFEPFDWFIEKLEPLEKDNLNLAAGSLSLLSKIKKLEAENTDLQTKLAEADDKIETIAHVAKTEIDICEVKLADAEKDFQARLAKAESKIKELIIENDGIKALDKMYKSKLAETEKLLQKAEHALLPFVEWFDAGEAEQVLTEIRARGKGVI